MVHPLETQERYELPGFGTQVGCLMQPPKRTTDATATPEALAWHLCLDRGSRQPRTHVHGCRAAWDGPWSQCLEFISRCCWLVIEWLLHGLCWLMVGEWLSQWFVDGWLMVC